MDIERANIKLVVDSIQENIKPLEYDKLLNENISSDTKYVLMGECTHGTEEFYKIRMNMTRLLVSKYNYRLILFEADWPSMYRINKYITSKDSIDKTAKEAVRGIKKYPLWMWRNEIIIELIEWLRDFNFKLSNDDDPVRLFGIDCYSLLDCRKWLYVFLDKVDPIYSNEIKGKLSFLDNYKDENEYARDVVHGKLKNYSNRIQEIFQSILAKIQWEKFDYFIKQCNKYKLDPVAAIAAEQICEIMINGDEYYRKLYLEPAGSQASWNTRDQHMIMTIIRLCDKLKLISKKEEDVKVIIWAHNSHVGDTNATNKGGETFDKNNTWNLGQMVRSMFGKEKSQIFGFQTYSGNVSASAKWDNPCKKYELNPAVEFSYEWFFHKVSICSDMNEFYINMKLYNEEECKKTKLIYYSLPDQFRYYHNINQIQENYSLDSKVIQKEVEIGKEFIAVERRILENGISRLKIKNGGWVTEYNPNGHIIKYCKKVGATIPNNIKDFFTSFNLQRMIGVMYHPHTEIQSHYSESKIAYQYDTIIYIDITNEIKPLTEDINISNRKYL